MIVVFAGPSLTPDDRAAHPGITFRPPAEQGDILVAAHHGATAIGLIDGYFGDRLAPHQKEILEALSMGIPVLGAASMGAMRAAELAPFGMIGVGAIFKGYRDGSIECDAEVAVSHGPQELGFPPTSVSMADVRATARTLIDRELIGSETARQIIAVALDLHFTARTRATLTKALDDLSPGLAATFDTHRTEQKRHDAQELLRLILSPDLAKPETPAPPRTSYYKAIRSRALARA